MIPGYYTSTSPFVRGAPFCEVDIIHPITGHATRFAALVDTGADDLQLEQSAASAAGLTLSSLSRKAVTTAGGTAYLAFAPSIAVEVQGKRLNVPVYFGPAGLVPILGRSTLLAALDIGVDKTDWGFV